MIIILQYICKSNHHTVYLKLIQGYMSITRGNLLKEKKKKRKNGGANKKQGQDFPSGPVVKIPPGLIPDTQV